MDTQTAFRQPEKAHDADGEPALSPAETADPARGKHGTAVKLAGAVLLAAAAIAAYLAWSHYAALYPSTNDAYVGAHVVHIAPEVTGTVETVGAGSFSPVKKGDLLVRIDPASFSNAVDAAQANLAQARQKVQMLQSAVNEAKAQLAAKKAVLADAQSAWDRIGPLVADGTVPKAQGDTQKAALREAKAGANAAASALETARAQLGVSGENNPLVLAAKAQLEAAKLNLAHTKITAPADGFTGKISARPGTLAAAGVEMFQLIETGDWWVDANFKESGLSRIKPGQKASVSVDMVPGIAFSGTVVSVSPASGASFSLFPPENATGNWVKVTQRFPVRIRLDPSPDLAALRVGGSATATVDTSGG
jgi:membrane fusion protein (multidrug efflux system)